MEKIVVNIPESIYQEQVELFDFDGQKIMAKSKLT